MSHVILLLLAHANALPTSDIKGEWINQRQTAIIRVLECPSGLCGTVIWSAGTAREDAARGGTAGLNGTTVMLGFIPTSPQHWRGKLFLPDQGRTVQATIELKASDELYVKGCELGGLVCKSQIWTRWAAE